MGDSATDWQTLSVPIQDPVFVWKQFEALLKDKETDRLPPTPELLSEADFASLTMGQRAAVFKVILKMMEVRDCNGDPSKLSQVTPLRMIIAGTAGTGKTRVIQSINSAGHHLLGPASVKNVAPSGTAAFLMKGKTIHSLFPIPIGPASYKPMTPPRADRLIKLQQELRGLTCLCLDERSMVGSVVFGWMEFMLRVGMNMGLTSNHS
jgi:hypothetical protein